MTKRNRKRSTAAKPSASTADPRRTPTEPAPPSEAEGPPADPDRFVTLFAVIRVAGHGYTRVELRLPWKEAGELLIDDEGQAREGCEIAEGAHPAEAISIVTHRLEQMWVRGEL